MNSKKFRAFLCIALSLIMLLPCFTVASFAADVTIVKNPTKATFYQGIDWAYNKSGVVSVIGGSFDISGTVLSYNSEEVTYSVDKWPNMYSKSDSGSWKAGKNTMRIYCDNFPSSAYATVQVNLIEAESISVVTPPKKTTLMQDSDWKFSGLGDVEFTELDLTGLKLNVKYNDGTSKIVSYPENQLISWAVPQNTDSIEPGKATIHATFCGKRAPFDVNFIRKGEKLSGDVSGDFKINSQDALMILQHSVGVITLDAATKVLADVSKDEKINSSDALMVLQYSVGLIPSL